MRITMPLISAALLMLCACEQSYRPMGGGNFGYKDRLLDAGMYHVETTYDDATKSEAFLNKRAAELCPRGYRLSNPHMTQKSTTDSANICTDQQRKALKGNLLHLVINGDSCSSPVTVITFHQEADVTCN